MKTFIKDMTSEQLQKVITDNENLQNEVLEILQENEIFFIQDVLNDLNLSKFQKIMQELKTKKEFCISVNWLDKAQKINSEMVQLIHENTQKMKAENFVRL